MNGHERNLDQLAFVRAGGSSEHTRNGQHDERADDQRHRTKDNSAPTFTVHIWGYIRAVGPLRIPDSPRARRRLVRLGVLAVIVGVTALVIVLIPNHQGINPRPTRAEGPAQLAVSSDLHISAADRRGINATLDRFLPAALTRKDPAAAWALAGPELRTGSSLAAWKAGTTPVPYYPVREKTFHTWSAIEVDHDAVIFNLLLHAKPSSGLGTYVFSGQVVKPHGVWLVNRLYTIAIMNSPTKKTYHEIGPRDFAAPPPTSQTPSGKPLLGHFGILPAVLILVLILAFPLAFAATALVRARRWRRHVQATARTELPPLPSSYLSNGRETQDLASRR